MRRNRPYPTKETARAYLAELAIAKQEGRICPDCRMNITERPAEFCVACKYAPHNATIKSNAEG
jgi:hypothetical protein